MNKKNIILILLSLFLALPAIASTPADNSESKVHYEITCLGLVIKRKALPTIFKIDLMALGNNSFSFTNIHTETFFTSVNPLFRKVINYKKYPSFSFNSTLTKSLVTSINKPISIPGNLTIHGVTKSTSITVTPTLIDKNKLVFKGHFTIKMTDFGINPPFLFLSPIDPEIKTFFELYTYISN